MTKELGMAIGKTCTCGRIHPYGSVLTIGLFDPFGGPLKYLAGYGGHPVRDTRAEAMNDICEGWTA